MVKNPPASAGEERDVGSTPGQEDPLEEGMATHSRILAWRTPWTEQPGGPRATGSQSQTRLSTYTGESEGCGLSPGPGDVTRQE